MIAIIGGGPAGSYCAYLLAKRGYDVNVYEEHNCIGKPVQCTGIVTDSINDIIKLDKGVIKNYIDKVKVFSPNNRYTEFRLKKNIILDREKFDLFIADKAKKEGARFFLNHKFLNIDRDYMTVKDNKNNKIKKIKADYLIGADGPLSQAAKSAGLFDKRRFYTGIQARVKIKSEPDVFDVYLGKAFPRFFGWVVPENDNIARVGLAAEKNANMYLNNFLKNKNIKQKDIIEYQGGLIPIYYSTRPRLQKGNVFLLGDAAMQVKATTGGGIIQGLIAAQCLSKAIISKKNYQKELKKTINKELIIHSKIRNILNNLSDRDYNYLISLFNNKKIKNILENYDRDYPSKFIFRLLINEPKFLYFVKNIF